LKESANILGSYVLQPTQNLFPNTMTLYTIRSSCQLQTKLVKVQEMNEWSTDFLLGGTDTAFWAACLYWTRHGDTKRDSTTQHFL